jgi:hypothetical protein
MDKIDIIYYKSEDGRIYKALMPCMKLGKKNFLLKGGLLQLFDDDRIFKNDVVCLSLLTQTNDPIRELLEVIKSSYLPELVPYLNIVNKDEIK